MTLIKPFSDGNEKLVIKHNCKGPTAKEWYKRYKHFACVHRGILKAGYVSTTWFGIMFTWMQESIYRNF